MNGQQLSKEASSQVSKSQNVRLADIFIYGPFMVWAGMQKELPKWARWLMVSLGVGTIYYNGRNYFATSSVQAPAQIDSLAEIFIQNWLDLLCKKDPRIVELYAPDGVLLPTFSSKVKKGRKEISGYFDEFMKKEELCGKVDTQVTHHLGNALTTSGIYTFGFKENGKPQTQSARYSFTFKPHNGNWLISSHHSSVLPKNGG